MSTIARLAVVVQRLRIVNGLFVLLLTCTRCTTSAAVGFEKMITRSMRKLFPTQPSENECAREPDDVENSDNEADDGAIASRVPVRTITPLEAKNPYSEVSYGALFALGVCAGITVFVALGLQLVEETIGMHNHLCNTGTPPVDVATAIIEQACSAHVMTLVFLSTVFHI